MGDLSVWKFDLPDDAESTVYMPRDAKVLSVQVQDGKPRVWALVDPKAEKVRRRFWVMGTGWKANADGLGAYVDTIQLSGGALVFHVFDGGEVPTQPESDPHG